MSRQDGAGLPHGPRATRAIAIAFAGVLASSLLLSFVVLGHHGPPASDLCGATITTDLKLDHDLVCSGNGITVGADGITIELKGHTITGPGNGFGFFTGIRANGRTDVSIEGPGTVTAFFVGIAITNSHEVRVEKLDVVANGRSGLGDGVRVLRSTEVEISKNVIARTSGDGVDATLSADIEIEKNTIQGNVVGVHIVQALTGNKIEKNVISGSGTSGVLIQASTGVEVEKNMISDSAQFGVRLFSATGNAFEKNTIVRNTCGVSGSVGNTFEKNTFNGDGTDFC